MSGVRIQNPDLLSLGMTLPGFINRGKVIASLPSLGCLTLAGLTPPDWELAYVEIDHLTDSTFDDVYEKSCDLVAISSLTARINDAYLLADELMKRGRTVVIGGLHASAVPEEARLHSDSVIVGEGEPVWQEVCSDYLVNRLKKEYRAERLHHFAPWSIPRYDLLNPSRYNRITLQTTRGCPLNCTFCGASRLISHYKTKPIELIEQELEAIDAIWPKPFIELADDNTFVNKKWAKEMIKVLKRKKVKWFTESDISIADDEELLTELASSGCAQILVGLESIDPGALDETDTKSWKRKRRSQYFESISKIQEKGISVNGCFIFGFDSDLPSVFDSTAEFALDSGLSEVQITILTPFPGTQLYHKLKHERRMLFENIWDKCTLFDVTFRPRGMSAKELESGFMNLAATLYSRENSSKRKAILNQCTRQRLKHA